MKYISTFFGLICMLTVSAQKSKYKVNLNNQQKIVVKTSSNSDVDMGMGMTMKNFTNSESHILVISADDKTYTVTNALKGLKLSMDMMGQSTTYDSDKKEDSASEIGRSVKLNIPDTFLLDKLNGTVTALKADTAKSTDDSNPMENMLESMGSRSDMAVEETFFVIPDGKKQGDNWTDSSSTKDSKTTWEFSLELIEKNIASIKYSKKVNSSIQAEVQGMQMTSTTDITTTGTMQVDIKNGLVVKRDAVSDLTGTVEVMGQSLPISGKVTTNTTSE